MTDTTLICATPKGDTPAPKGAPEPSLVEKAMAALRPKGNPGKPVSAMQAPRDHEDDFVLPQALNRAAGKTKEEIDAEREQAIAKTTNADGSRKIVDPITPKEAREARLAARPETEKVKAKVRVEKMKAKQSGATKAMPVTGRAALALIHGGKATKPAKAAGKLPVPPPKAAKLAEPSSGYAKAKASAKKTKVPAEGRGTKLEAIAALLKRKNGCTAAEVLEATQWPSVSMPQQAKAAGLKLRKEKVPGKPTRYFAG